jgi:hypothetical protein
MIALTTDVLAEINGPSPATKLSVRGTFLLTIWEARLSTRIRRPGPFPYGNLVNQEIPTADQGSRTVFSQGFPKGSGPRKAARRWSRRLGLVRLSSSTPVLD